MGIVIAAHHLLLDVPVAVKLLSPELVRRQDIVERFLREAQAVARLKSEHVARIMDMGTLETGQPFIVMELLEGEDLEKRLARLGRIDVREAVDCVLQALEAIAQAHAAGIVHRDLKPANLFVTVTPDGSEIVKVLDFGIAKLTDARPVDREGKRSGAITGEHAVLGSPSYMSPEQLRDSGKIDQRADLWALGTILYELVTGAPAFDGPSLADIFAAILHETPVPISTRAAEAPPALGQVIARCLERDPEKRWADAAQLARALAPLGSGDFTGYCERIEQTLARAGKTSEPDGIPPSVTRPRMKIRSSGAFSPAQAVARTMLEVSQPVPPPPRSSAGIKALFGGALVVLVPGLVVVYVMHARAHHAAPPTMSVNPPPSVSAAVAPPVPAPSASASATLASASTTPSASALASASAPASSPPAQGGRARPPRARPSPAPARTTGLPGVLDSPN